MASALAVSGATKPRYDISSPLLYHLSLSIPNIPLLIPLSFLSTHIFVEHAPERV
jgi:hypothetical protein